MNCETLEICQKTNEDILLELIYRTNGVRLNPLNTYFNLPKKIDDTTPALTSLKIELSDLVRSSTRGQKTFFYYRLNFSLLENKYPPIYINQKEIATTDLVPLINFHYGLDLKESDVVYKIISSQDVPYKLTASDVNLVWVGDLKVNLKFSPLMLNKTNLDGFRPANTLFRKQELDGFRNYIVWNRALSGFQ